MRPLNILSFPLQTISDTDFCSVGHKWFYLISKVWAPGWNTMFEPFPVNAQIVNSKEYIISSKVNWTLPMIREKYLEELKIDLVLAAGIESCYFALQWGYPVIQYVNFITIDEYGRSWFRHLTKRHPEIPIIFPSEDNARRSGVEKGTYKIIGRGWDLNDYEEWQGDTEKVLTICTGMFGRSYFDFPACYKKISANLPTHLIGYSNKDLSKGKPHFLIKKAMSEYRVLFNMDPLSGRIMFEAMAAGIPVVSVQREDALKSLIKNGVNGFMSENMNYLIASAKELLKNKELARKIGKEGQKIIKEHFPKSVYKEKWNNLFYETTGVK